MLYLPTHNDVLDPPPGFDFFIDVPLEKETNQENLKKKTPKTPVLANHWGGGGVGRRGLTHTKRNERQGKKKRKEN